MSNLSWPLCDKKDFEEKICCSYCGDFIVNDHVICGMKKDNDRLNQENLKEYKTICQDLHKTLALTQVSLLTLEERLINQENVSYNGHLLWKITNVHDKMLEARSGRQTSFYSPPFYTNEEGYKMCARIYLNGDGNGRDTHLSLFFVILRGEYDALLTWPFRQKVTFTLLDQSESKEHVVNSFRPDPNSSSFQRPISEKNNGSGSPQFCSFNLLTHTFKGYLKENVMFIKINVDCEEKKESPIPEIDNDPQEPRPSIEETNISSTIPERTNRCF